VQAGDFPLILDVVISNSSRNNNSKIRKKGVNNNKNKLFKETEAINYKTNCKNINDSLYNFFTIYISFDISNLFKI
jgi:hypothetical protein